MIRRILLASDFSSASRPAFARAVALANANRAELTVAHVLTPALPVIENGYMSAEAYRDMETAARRYGQKQLDALVTTAKRAGVRSRALLLEGARLMIGSVANGVMSHARCPVLTVGGK